MVHFGRNLLEDFGRKQVVHSRAKLDTTGLKTQPVPLGNGHGGVYLIVGCTFENDVTTRQPVHVSLTITDGRRYARLLPHYASFADNQTELRQHNFNAGVVVRRTPRNGQASWTAYIILPEAKKMLITRLFLLDEHLQGYERVYNDGFAMIWKLNPNPSIHPDVAYIEPDFVSNELKAAWTPHDK